MSTKVDNQIAFHPFKQSEFIFDDLDDSRKANYL